MSSYIIAGSADEPNTGEVTLKLLISKQYMNFI
jgi:hypothetical protein